MARYLTTFPGRVGDILWSLKTVKHISDAVSEPVDFKIMPRCASVLPLLNEQPYIARASIIDDWAFHHSSYGDQPWQPPAHVEAGYERVWHLGYRGEPQEPLVDCIATQQGIVLSGASPFIYAGEPIRDSEYVAIGIGNPQDYDFLRILGNLIAPMPLVVSVTLPWPETARLLKYAAAFVGGRGPNYVLAHGLCRKIIAYEQDTARRHRNFTNPYWPEVMLPLGPPEEQAQIAAAEIRRPW